MGVIDTLEFYVKELQGHPSRCNTPEEVVTVLKENVYVKKYFTDKKQPLLVIGCGEGKEVKAFMDMEFKRVCGITQGGVNIEHAAKHGLCVLDIDMHCLAEFRPGTQKYVYCNQTFEHAYAPFIVCLEVHTIMQDDGIWYIQVPPHSSENRSLLTDPLTCELSHHHPNMMLLEDMKLLFTKTGFEILDINTSDNIFILRKKSIFELEQNNDVHSDVLNALKKRTFLTW